MVSHSVKEQILNELKEFGHAQISNASVKAYLIKRTRKRNILEKFTTHRVPIADEMANNYRKSFLESLQERGFTDDNIPNVKNFSDPSLVESDEMYVIPKGALQELDGLIQDLESHNDIAPIQELDLMKDAHLYCLEFAIGDHEVFTIARVENVYSKDNSQYILAEFKSDEIVPVKKNLVQFSKSIMCVYFKNTKLVLILNPTGAANALSFSDQYKKKSKEIISQEWDIIDIPEGLLEKVLANNIYNKALVKLHNAHRLFSDIERYVKYNQICKEQHLDLEPLIIKHDKLLIEKPQQLENALHASDNTLVEGVLVAGEYSLALRRKPVRRRQV